MINFFLLFLCLTLTFAVGSTAAPIIKDAKRMHMTDKAVFTEIYNTEEWGGWKEVGPGSTVEDGATPFLNYLQNFLDSHSDITSIVDIGCGYGELLKNINWPKNTTYLGIDIVDSVIEYNQKHYKKENINFSTVNDLTTLSEFKGDLLILKDVLGCWNIQSIMYAIKNILPNFKYIIVVTNIHASYADVQKKNSDIVQGTGRPLDLEIEPLLMKPSCLVPYCREEGYELKCKEEEALWDRYYTAAPAQQRQCVERYKIVKRA